MNTRIRAIVYHHINLKLLNSSQPMPDTTSWDYQSLWRRLSEVI